MSRASLKLDAVAVRVRRGAAMIVELLKDRQRAERPDADVPRPDRRGYQRMALVVVPVHQARLGVQIDRCLCLG